MGIMHINALSTKDTVTISDSIYVELNTYLQLEKNGVQTTAYWVQDGASLNTTTKRVSFLDNVWNTTIPNANVSDSAISGTGGVYSATVNGSSQYYYESDTASQGNVAILSYPSTIELRINSSTDASGNPSVTMEYNDGNGWQEYDQIVFTAESAGTQAIGLVVNGSTIVPANSSMAKGTSSRIRSLSSVEAVVDIMQRICGLMSSSSWSTGTDITIDR
jgi:hypothetical protein